MTRRERGYRAISALGVLLFSYTLDAQSRLVAMTVDDLPYVSGLPIPLNPSQASRAKQVNQTILNAFSRHHVPATGFVIEQHIEQIGLPAGRQILKQWIRPGFDLGNHFYSHADVNTLTTEQVEQEITKGETTFAPLLESNSRRPQFLRFPYNHTGDTKEKHDSIAAFMSVRGYRLAPCTIDNSDYLFATAYALASKRHDQSVVSKIRSDYITYTGAEIDWYTALNRRVFRYEPPHVMLLHDNALNADTINDVLSLFTQRGYTFVTLADALKDPAYDVPETFVTQYGPMWGYRWAQELNVKVSGRDEPDPPAWIQQYVNEHQSGQ